MVIMLMKHIVKKTLPVEEYVQMLKKAGFKSITYYSDFGEYKEECERIIFVVKKVRD